eukprot:TRINITY_DN42327_c0_g2_i1.p1 TRINITY_DN42327_c0_g2~~TRINITY_DN42327_c0_g2_i1.p1  ORF type:complete len:414 (+),score=48.85 TRINITY_DN42327_c0_g2_i1:105-1346(+)
MDPTARFTQGYVVRLQNLRQWATQQHEELTLPLKQQIADLRAENKRLEAENDTMRGPPLRLDSVMTDHGGPIHSVCSWASAQPFNPEDRLRYGSYLATASWDGALRIIDLDKGKVVKVMKPPPFQAEGMPEPVPAGLYGVQFGKTQLSKHLVGCACSDSKAYIFDFESGKQMQYFQHDGEVNCIDFHEEQNVIATASDDKSCRIWDYKDPHSQCLRLLKVKDTDVKCVYGCRFLGKTKPWEFCVSTISHDGVMRIWDMRSNTPIKEFKGHSDDGIGIDFHPATHQLATSGDDGQIFFYDLRMLPGTPIKVDQEVRRIDAAALAGFPEGAVKRLRYSPDGKRIAAAVQSAAAVFDPTGVEECAVNDGGNPEDTVFDVAWRTSPLGCLQLISCSHGDSESNPPIAPTVKMYDLRE